MNFFKFGTFTRCNLALTGVVTIALTFNSLGATPPVEIVWQKLPALPDMEGFSGGFAGVSNSALIFAGGTNFVGKRPWDGGKKTWYDTVYVLASLNSQWIVAGKLPKPAAYGVSATYRDEMICVGGSNGHEHYSDVYALRWDGHIVRQRRLPSLPKQYAFMSGAIAGDILYVLGGINQPDSTTAQRDFWALDLGQAKPTWRMLDPLPGAGRIQPNVGTWGDTLVVFSGVDVEPSVSGKPDWNYLTDSYSYTPENGWRRLSDLPHAAESCPGPLPVTRNGRFLLVSGDDGALRKLDGPTHPGFRRDSLLYDSQLDRWEVIEAGPVSLCDTPTAIWNNLWIIPGGEHKPGYRSNEVWGLQFSDK